MAYYFHFVKVLKKFFFENEFFRPLIKNKYLFVMVLPKWSTR